MVLPSTCRSVLPSESQNSASSSSRVLLHDVMTCRRLEVGAGCVLPGVLAEVSGTSTYMRTVAALRVQQCTHQQPGRVQHMPHRDPVLLPAAQGQLQIHKPQQEDGYCVGVTCWSKMQVQPDHLPWGLAERPTASSVPLSVMMSTPLPWSHVSRSSCYSTSL